MALVEVPLLAYQGRLPADVEQLIADARQRIEQFVETRIKQPIVSFVPSDFVSVYRTLRAITDENLGIGNKFCEWGAGFGVATSLASLLGWDAIGIEIEQELVDAANQLANEYEIPVEFACGNCLPEVAFWQEQQESGPRWVTEMEDSVYDDLDIEIDDFAVIYAYPWPGEESLTEQAFEKHAATGALLLTYRGHGRIKVQRKVARTHHTRKTR